MDPPNELFRLICVSKPVKEFYSTPIHRFFRLKAVPGISDKDEHRLLKKGMKTPMDLVCKIREYKKNKNYRSQRWRTLQMVEYLNDIGMHALRVYQAAVSIVSIEMNAPREGVIAL